MIPSDVDREQYRRRKCDFMGRRSDLFPFFSIRDPDYAGIYEIRSKAENTQRGSNKPFPRKNSLI